MQAAAFITKPKRRVYVTVTDPATRKSKCVTLYGMTLTQALAHISGENAPKSDANPQPVAAAA